MRLAGQGAGRERKAYKSEGRGFGTVDESSFRVGFSARAVCLFLFPSYLFRWPFPRTGRALKIRAVTIYKSAFMVTRVYLQ